MADLAPVITSVGTFIGAVGALGVTIYNARKRSQAEKAAAERADAIWAAAAAATKAAEDASAAIVEVDGKVFRLGVRVDGRLTELLKKTQDEGLARAILARAEGVAQGEQAQRDRAAEPVKEPNGGST